MSDTPTDFTGQTPAPAFMAAPTRSPWRIATIIAVLAFLGGLIAMAAILHYQSRWFPAQQTVAAVPKGQLPVVVVPATGAPAAVAPVIDLNALSSRENELDARLADLEARTARVSTDAQTASGYATRAEGMMIAFAARRALDRGLTLGYVEQHLRARFGAGQPRAVAAILQAAREPVTITELRAGLDGIAPELVTGAASTGWWSSFRRELGNLVVLHQATTPSPLPVDRLARARQLLEAGKVEAALAEVARMPGAAQATRWTAAARRYIGARRALDTIEAAAILGQSGAADLSDDETNPTG
ncbi:outer membrane murein-binding lipoprotein Lpp [Sphingomonas sp. UYAg733]